MKSIKIEGYEIIMEDEKYNDILNKAKKLKDVLFLSEITMDECIIWIIGDDIEEYRHKKGLW